MRRKFVTLAFVVALSSAPLALVAPLSGTSFHDFATGVSVNNQGGWSVFTPGNCGPYDESVVNFAGNRVWRVSNAVTCGSFGDQPFAPRPGGIPNNTVSDPDNSEPYFFAGEESTGAAFNNFSSQFSFRSATGAAQPGLRITVSPDNGSGGRQGFIALLDTGYGIDVQTVDVDKNGEFGDLFTIAKDLSYTDWHSIGIEVVFKKGKGKDKVNYYVDDKKRHSGPSWEDFYRNFQATLHPLGVPVQTLLFRISGTAAPSVLGGGFYIDNVFTMVHDHGEGIN